MSADGAPGWDDWPPAPPPADDYVVEEPLPPSSDPWAESWTTEEADAILGSAPEPVAPAEPDLPEPPSAERWEPEPEVVSRAPEPRMEPRIEPWSPDSDPWRYEPEPDVRPEPVPEPTPEPGSEMQAEPEPAPLPGWEARPEDPPVWLAEPISEAPEPEPEIEPEPEAAAVPEPHWAAAETDFARPDSWLAREATPELDAEPASPEVEADVKPDLQPDAEPAVDATAEPPAAEPAPETLGPRSTWRSALPWFSDGTAEAPGEEPDVALAEPEPEPQVEPEPVTEPELEPEPDREAEADLEWQAAREPEPETEPEPEPTAQAQPEPEPPVIPITGGLTVDEPEPSDPWGELAWPDRGDSTQVLPTSWTPREPEATGELDATAGPIRTSLAEAEADRGADDEELETTSMVEQAVPWLIGVILLLAGMVIVLLALIFAGDGSLGGAAPTPDPTLAVAVPSEQPSSTPAPTPTPSVAPVASAEPSPSPDSTPGPRYGPLEMVYQGRSAALAPIYLLRRDFTVDDDPAVMAQDEAHDVRRFAWAPDGRAGACLLADVLVSIEPGADKRRLGDGLTTITFGDDTSTVYAVRVTQDGGDDVATVLAIDFESGEAEELGKVAYARPEIDARRALSEAQFNDDGGTIRLFWMSDDTLRLWALGAGAWTIDPADGTVTELDGEPHPTLWSPDGRRRIRLEADGGVTRIHLANENDRVLATTTVEGRVSHVRWSPGSDRAVFTVGRSAAGGGVIQNLFIWYLDDGEAPIQMTDTGAAFGAEWLGTQPLWKD